MYLVFFFFFLFQYIENKVQEKQKIIPDLYITELKSPRKIFKHDTHARTHKSIDHHLITLNLTGKTATVNSI